MSPEKAGLQTDRLLQKVGTLFQSLLLKTNCAQDGTGDGPSLWIGEREACLLVSFVQTPLLNQLGGPLESSS